MRRLRFYLAIMLGKLAGSMSRLFGRGKGAVLPGTVAGFLMPDLLSLLSGMVEKDVFVVTGTNGKTTVNRMICECLEREGEQVVCNRTGANLPAGVLSAFVEAAGFTGRLTADYACLEVDELAAEEILGQMKPDVVILTNIFRDQLDRSGEVDRTLERLEGALRLVKNAKVIYNGDDCLLRRIAIRCENPQAAYGIEETFCGEAFRSGNREGSFCWFCGSRLEYRRIQYGQLGDYRCPGCGFGRPEPRYTASDIRRLENWYSFALNGRPVLARTCSPYEVYNTLAAYSALRESQAPMGHFREGVAGFDYGNRREPVFLIGDSRVQLHLAKNPVGFQQKLALLAQDPEPKDLVFQINDEVPDGRDVSWLWDVEFERLLGTEVKMVVVTGSRRYDMEVRLKYENIPCLVSKELLKPIRELLRTGTGNLYVIVNYSGLYRTGRLLRKLRRTEKGEWRN